MSEFDPSKDYDFDPVRRVWYRRQGTEEFNYSDGDETEQYLLQCVTEAEDCSVFSSELKAVIRDWPSAYHFGSDRSNLLRPFQSRMKGSVLEIGCGCGAITRYLGESCPASVTALEGSFVRAEIAAARNRDLPNVTVVCDDFFRFGEGQDTEARFDVITLIGVLEYAHLFCDEENAAQIMLEKAQSLLKDDGFLILAIENRFGLKYFTGAPEDHLNQPFVGLQDSYPKKGPKTYGRLELQSLLQESGYSENKFFVPFPDYKQPQMILTPRAVQDSQLARQVLVGQSAPEQAKEIVRLFSEEASWSVVAQNNLVSDLANSHLIIASKNSEATEDVCSEDALFVYTHGRRVEFMKTTSISYDEDSRLKVFRTPFLSTEVRDDIIENLHKEAGVDSVTQSFETEDFIAGVSYVEQFYQIINRDGWRSSDIASWALTWAEFLRGKVCSPASSASLELPPEFLDCVPQNIVVQPDGALAAFDLEWCSRHPVSLEWLLFRGIKNCILAPASFAEPHGSTPRNRRLLVSEVLEKLGVKVTATKLSGWIREEERLTAHVFGTEGRLYQVLEQRIPVRLPITKFEELPALQTITQSLRSVLQRKGEEKVQELSISDMCRKIEEHLQHSDRIQERLSEAEEREQQFLSYAEETFQRSCRSSVDVLSLVDKRFRRDQMIAARLQVRLDGLLRSSERAEQYRQELLSRFQDPALLSSYYSGLVQEVRECQHWFGEFRNHMKMLRSSRSWKVMRFLRRVTRMLIEGREEGRFAFLRWAFSQLTGGEYRTHLSYDPFESLIEPPTPIVPEGLQTFPEFASALQEFSGAPEYEQLHEERERSLTVNKETFAEPEVLYAGTPTKARCDVVIPVKNSVHWVVRCLQELLGRNGDDVREIILVDDGSSAHEFTLLQAIVERIGGKVTLLRNTGEPGFGNTCNVGASYSRAPYVFFLNSDCLLADDVIRKMSEVCDQDPTIGLVCAMANNAVNLSVDLPEGFSYLDVNTLLGQAYLGASRGATAVEVCTVLGHALMVTRACWDTIGGFDPAWGLGYGEESDLQLRAARHGFRGVTLSDAFVYHFGGGTFQYEAGRTELQQRNHRLFMQKWSKDYQDLFERCKDKEPAPVATKLLNTYRETVSRPDVLFVLPGLVQGIGGIQVVADICNSLILRGMDAKFGVLGDVDINVALGSYSEMLLFRPFHFRNEEELLKRHNLQPRMVVSTLFSTVAPLVRFAKVRQIPVLNFIQGYEFFFSEGRHYDEVERSYHLADANLVTSPWLGEGCRRHAPDVALFHLPIGINRTIFFPEVTSSGELRTPLEGERVRIGMVMRSAPDKGQFILREILAMLSELRTQISVTVFAPRDYELDSGWLMDNETNIVRLPADRYSIAKELRGVDVFFDASFHEGFGLMPLEAMASGATVIVANSGGVSQFVEDQVNGVIVREVNQPRKYVEALRPLLEDRTRLGAFQREALRVTENFDEEVCMDRYRRFFQNFLEEKGVPVGFGVEDASSKLAS